VQGCCGLSASLTGDEDLADAHPLQQYIASTFFAMTTVLTVG
jgi:hypothetical protein